MTHASSAPRTVLCFGDSNTWGYVPGSGGRYPRDARWTGVLQRRLGADWYVVEAGLNGRTTVFEDPLGDRCGRRHLGPVLASAAPLDVVVLMLGTNDLKTRFRASAFDVAQGAALLVDVIGSSAVGPGGAAPQVVLVAPPPLASLAAVAERAPEAVEAFEATWRGARASSLDLAKQLRREAEARSVAFVDAGQFVVTSDVDGVHWSAEGHDAFGRAVATVVQPLASRKDRT